MHLEECVVLNTVLNGGDVTDLNLSISQVVAKIFFGKQINYDTPRIVYGIVL